MRARIARGTARPLGRRLPEGRRYGVVAGVGRALRALHQFRFDADALAFLLERQLFEEGWDSVYEGEVVGLIGGGLFIRFGGVFEGLLPSRALGGERFEVDELEVSLVGTSSGRRHRLGDSMPVRVRRIDRPRGRVQLDRTGAGGA